MPCSLLLARNFANKCIDSLDLKSGYILIDVETGSSGKDKRARVGHRAVQIDELILLLVLHGQLCFQADSEVELAEDEGVDEVEYFESIWFSKSYSILFECKISNPMQRPNLTCIRCANEK
ncbi:hypothetical protein BpHYR1_043213 [Brachionus plicatilis]|uniref:Uncharacterized protein n=1 Tax=Brachionus plicatilis TaxID=10195 RepID=A0A3M7RRI6_BRAPC|nr:hypothetical protein BpHYR1_043213 [Brachionus plicatilis]